VPRPIAEGLAVTRQQVAGAAAQALGVEGGVARDLQLRRDRSPIAHVVGLEGEGDVVAAIGAVCAVRPVEAIGTVGTVGPIGAIGAIGAIAGGGVFVGASAQHQGERERRGEGKQGAHGRLLSPSP